MGAPPQKPHTLTFAKILRLTSKTGRIEMVSVNTAEKDPIGSRSAGHDLPAGSAKPLVLILHGPSGVGKESVIEGLQQATSIHRATSTTDRPPRDNEQDRIDYHFVSTDEFERRINAGRFAERARVYGEWKGLERSEIDVPLAEGRDVIIRTDVQGAKTWRGLLQGAISVLIVAAEPSASREQHRAITRARIVSREPAIEPLKLESRLSELDQELETADENDYIIVNRDGELGRAVADLLEIIDRERTNPARPSPVLK